MKAASYLAAYATLSDSLDCMTKGTKRVFLADGGTELDTGQSVLLAPFYAGEAYVGDDT